MHKGKKYVIVSFGPAKTGYIRNEQQFVIARSVSDEAISTASDITRFTQAIRGLRPSGTFTCVHFCCLAEMELHPPRWIRNDSSCFIMRSKVTK